VTNLHQLTSDSRLRQLALQGYKIEIIGCCDVTS